MLKPSTAASVNLDELMSGERKGRCFKSPRIALKDKIFNSSLEGASSASDGKGSNDTREDSDIFDTLTASLSLAFPAVLRFGFLLPFFNGFLSELHDLDRDLDPDFDLFFLRLVGTCLCASVSRTGSLSRFKLEQEEFRDGGL